MGQQRQQGALSTAHTVSQDDREASDVMRVMSSEAIVTSAHALCGARHASCDTRVCNGTVQFCSEKSQSVLACFGVAVFIVVVVAAAAAPAASMLSPGTEMRRNGSQQRVEQVSVVWDRSLHQQSSRSRVLRFQQGDTRLQISHEAA